MDKLIAVSFNEKPQPVQLLNKFVGLQQDYLLDLEDAEVEVGDDDGKVKIPQSVNLTAEGAAQGGLWGSLIGWSIGY